MCVCMCVWYMYWCCVFVHVVYMCLCVVNVCVLCVVCMRVEDYLYVCFTERKVPPIFIPSNLRASLLQGYLSEAQS